MVQNLIWLITSEDAPTYISNISVLYKYSKVGRPKIDNSLFQALEIKTNLTIWLFVVVIGLGTLVNMHYFLAENVIFSIFLAVIPGTSIYKYKIFFLITE